ncbi:TIGR04255 family protein [Microcoleus sp. MON1_C5]|uniref:TIGR04255 family protein n=1 Tax=Microcoleus sp. MON1_C5 TaxID=2818828 RepID=UPI002FCFEBC1
MTVSVNTRQLPSYDQPPVSEVVCSVLFDSIEALLSPHIGLLWQRFQPDYPFCDDVAPLPSKVEVFNNPIIEPQLELSNIFPLPRVWFISSDETRVIQIQRDRLIHNWRKISLNSEYPRYGSLIKAFQDHLNCFNSFIEEADLGKLQIHQYELTYVNQISQGEAWETLEDIGKIFPDFKWQTGLDRFLPKPQSIDWDTTFDLPEEFGRLRISIRNVVFNNHPTLLFELTVRGIGNYNSLDSMQSWFDVAHEWIVQTFADLTDEKIQTTVWKRRG